MQVSKWGDSLAVRIPKALAEEMGLRAGDKIDLVRVGERAIALAPRGEDGGFLDRLREVQEPAPEGYRWRREDAVRR